MKKDHPYWPLIASLLTLPWTALAFGVLLVLAWGTQHQPKPGIPVDPGLVSAIPALAGLVLGVVQIVRGGTRTTAQQTWLWIGTVLCGVWSYALTFGLVH